MGFTLSEKLLQAHTDEEIRGPGQIVQCRVDLVLGHDMTAPLGIKAFVEMGATKLFDPQKVVLVCDHCSPNKDIASAEQIRYVRDFARKMGAKYFENAFGGIEHVIVPEFGLVAPGDLAVGTASHTTTFGALGAFATGIGSTEFAAVMALGETWFKVPESFKVEFTGHLPPYIGGKDLVLELIGRIGVSGALYMALEFCGSVEEALEVEQRQTISNMAVEAGAKAGLFPADAKAVAYATNAGRSGLREIYPDEDAVYSKKITIDVTGMSPRVAKPHLPENTVGVEEVSGIKVDQVFLGSCTNGRISDMRMAAEILKGNRINQNLRMVVLPGSHGVLKQVLAEGLVETFVDAGAVVGPPSCGPCAGLHLGVLAPGEKCLSTSNRNFKGRMGSLDAQLYLAGPAVAAATAVAGTISHPADITGRNLHEN